MKESCCRFGPGRRLAGVITEPHGRPARLGLVLISAGLSPKFGPYRLYAQLARRLSEDGIVTLRFDLGGIGDSEQEHERRPLQERTKLEVQAALDHLTKLYELKGIILGGLCSGAEDAFRGASYDSRVTRVVLIDPFAYRTAGWVWRHALHRAARRALRALHYYVAPAPQNTSAAPAQKKPPKLLTYKYMERSESTIMLRGLVARNVRVHFMYTAGMREFFNHERQLRAMFGDLANHATVDYFPRLDHTQLLDEDRRTLVESIASRLREANRLEERASDLEPNPSGVEHRQPEHCADAVANRA